MEGRAFLGLNPFCRIKYYKGQLLKVVLPCMTQLFIPGHKYFLGHMVNTLAVKNPFCRIKYYKGQLLKVVLPCMTQLFIPGHKYFLGHMVNTLAVK